MHQSIATIDSPEFVNLQPLELNPLMSSCEIKVLYLGKNRNHSYITKEVATEMSKTLRGAPIVGYYKKDKEDFADHGERVILDDEGIKFECMTKPYGFVSPDAKVWFQKFEDTDEFGNAIVREYLMTTGYLWTGQFEECKSAVESGKPHSMELDGDTLDGHWSTDNNDGMDFFIINDAIFSKLCILGDDVEPCFEGSSVTAPNVSKTFSMDDSFKNTLFTMMQDLKKVTFASEEKEGGKTMENIEKTNVEFSDNNDENTMLENQNSTEGNPSSGTEFAKDDKEKKKEDESEAKEDPKKDDEETDPEEEDKKKKSFAKDKKEEEEEKKDNETPSKEESDEKENDEEDEDDKKKKNPALKHQFSEEEYNSLNKMFNELQTLYNNLEAEYKKLSDFKDSVDSAKKDELIKSFYMLSDEDKKEVIENKDKYSYDDIEAKLSVICVRKKVSFDLETPEETTEQPVVTFNLENEESSVPAWIKALRNAKHDN